MASKQKLAPQARTALTTSAVLVLLAELLAEGTFAFLAGLITFFLVIFAMTKMPLRYSMMGLAFFALLLPNAGEGLPTKWNPPLLVTGGALMCHLNVLDRGHPILALIPVSGMEMFFLVLGLIVLQRGGRSK